MLDRIISKTCAKYALVACVLVNSAVFTATALAANAPAILEGDILSESADQRRGVVHAQVDRVWPNGVIPYVLHDNLTAVEKGRVLDAAQHWNDSTEISLIPLSDVPAALAQDYVLFMPGQGCASWVGRQGGEQEIWVGADCSVGSVIHEIGHAVGFVHEHTRPDRDQYITIAWENIAEEKQHNFDVPDHNVETRGPYDYDSIMHYGEMFFSTNGSPTIEVLGDEAANLGQRVALSEGDIAAVASMYGSDLSLSSTQDLVDGNTELSLTISNASERDANELVVTIPTDGRAVLAQSDNDWQCAVESAAVVCALDTLAGSTSATVVVLVEGLSKLNREFLLESKTHDLNNVNNSLAEKKLVKSDSEVTQAAGAGSFGWMLLLTLVPLIVRRQKRI